MKINKKINKEFPIVNYDDFYVVADFDRTITNGDSKTSWSVLSSSKLVPDKYKEDRNKLYEKYRPIEIDEKMDYEKRIELVSEWFKKHIELFVKYEISDKIFKNAATNLRVMEFRKGAKEFLEFLNNNSIPLIIISAGIGNFIEEFLTLNNCYYDNIYISSNKIIFKDGVAVGVDNNIIHSLNKNEVSLPKHIKEKIVNRINKVTDIYQQIFPTLAILGALCYLVITIKLVINFIKKIKDKINFDIWLILTSILLSYVVLIGGVSYNQVSAVESGYYMYRSGGYPLIISFVMIAIAFIVDRIITVYKNKSNKSLDEN